MRAFYNLCLVVLAVCMAQYALAGVTGKIAGTVKDGRTGEKVISANVIIEGTRLGTITSTDGYFTILNVPPGTYRVVASLIGYKQATITNVRVDIDQTTNLDITLNEEAVEAGEVVIVAQRPVVQKDVSASRANIEIADVEKLPVTSVAGAVGLQAGVQGLSIRGGTIDQTAFVVDGLTLRDERTNNPYSGISLSSVQDIQVQTGGFNAEYGNVRSGVVNVVTKEGGSEKYSFSFIGRYTPAAPKHFGSSVYDRNAYWIRPFLDESICWTGTNNGVWDKYTASQYAPFPGGWNGVSAALMKDPDPSRHLSPEAARQLFLWEHRKQAEVKDPDWDVDMGLGGPVPFAQSLGNLRFFASYRQTVNMYIVPLSAPGYRDYNGQLKLTSDIAGNMKLSATMMLGRTTGTSDNNAGSPGVFSSQSDIANAMSQVSYIDTRLFATDYWAPTLVKYTMFGTKLSHVLSASTFYDVSATYFRSKYSTNPGALRDKTKSIMFGGVYFADASPFGFDPNPDPPSSLISTLRYGLGFSNTRDTSSVATITVKGDLTSQVDRYNQVKTGFEVAYTDNNARYAQFDAGLPRSNTNSSWHTFPWRGALYVQDKLEFQGMIANLGVRMDVLDPNGDWYDVTNPYDPAFTGAKSLGIDTLIARSKVPKITTISPRLGIAFPISDESKLFFNYGHSRQVPAPENLFLLRRSGFDNTVTRLADPTAPFPKTISYELGYEHSLFDEYLIRVAGYYKDISNEAFLVTYTSRNSAVNYTETTSNRYRDIRGAEFTVSKNRGEWLQGFINYTYDVRSTGYFGAGRQYESASAQADYVKTNVYQDKPVPQPYARVDIDFFTPREFGPKFGGFGILEDWRVNLVGSWSSGYYLTWTGGGSRPGISNNLQWTDFYNFDMRISKNIPIGRFNVQLFADISNLLNTKYMTQYGFVDGVDYQSYMKSLHLSSDHALELGYINVPGDDRPGQYRKSGVEFQPIEPVATMANLTAISGAGSRAFYYVAATGQYFQYVNNSWQLVDQGRLQQVLDDKAYIDMPNQDTFTFLNPRRIFWGIRLSMDF